jgi:hypothetical protein
VYTTGLSKICRYDGTWVETTMPAGHTAAAIWGRTETDLYAAGSAILRYDGTGWTTAFAPTLTAGAYFYSLHGNATSLAAATTDGRVAFFDGTTWSFDEVEAGWFIQSIYVDGASRVYVVASGTLRVRTSSGWTDAGKPTGASELRFPWGLGEKIYVQGFAESGGTSVWQYDGVAWLEIPNTVSDVSMFTGSKSHLVVTATYDSFYEWSGYGWSALRGTQDAIADVWASSSDHVYATDGTSVLYFDGDTWSQSNVLGGRAEAIWGSGADFVVIGGNGIVRQKSGASWLDMPVSVPFNVRDLWGDSPTNLYAAGSSESGATAVVHHWNGTSWQQIMSWSGAVTFDSVVGSSTGTYVLSRDYGAATIYFHAAADLLEDWSALTLPTSVDPVGIWCDDQRLIVSFADRTVYQLVGTTWTKLATSLRAPPLRLSGDASDLFGTTSTDFSSNVLFHSNGLTWDEVTPPSEISRGTTAVFAGNGVVVVGGAEGVSILVRP